VRETLADPAVRKRLEDIGQEITPAEQQTPEYLRAHLKAETEKWWPVINAAGIKAQ
jgi:tripartite-type tricarboxylate transporter receptor subunit TctC